MARHKHYQADPAPEPDLDISSLIDVCFLLLIYFLATSTIAPRERGLDLKLPGFAETPASPNIESLVISIDGSGRVSTGLDDSLRIMDADPSSRNLPHLLAQLELYASAARASNSTPLVRLRAEDQAPQQRVIDVLNALAKTRIKSVAFDDLLP